jgi:superfamily II DNA or RNA helicase
MLDRFGTDENALGALAYMPTGTGKSAIIAISARANAIGKAVVVLSPAAALSRQLQQDINQVVWSRLGVGAPWTDIKTVELLRSNRQALLEAIRAAPYSPICFVGTLQALYDIQTQAPDIYALIRDIAGLVLVDEGHREPAPAWSIAVEGLRARVVLFSATPYRNDFRVFNISRQFISYMSFSAATRAGIIRDVEILRMGATATAGQFATAAVAQFADLVANGRIEIDAKAIMRFASRTALDDATSALASDEVAQGLGFVAVHDRYHDDTGPRVHAISDLRSRTERLFLHQFKLSEGVDEPRCSVLFIHKDFGNERQLIQQIGRVVRRRIPRGPNERPAIVFISSASHADDSWAAYREYDKVRDEMNDPAVVDPESYGRRLRSLGVPVEYGGRKFRVGPPTSLDVIPATEAERLEQERARLGLIGDVLPQRRCLVFQVSREFELDSYFDALVTEFGSHDRVVLAAGTPSIEADEMARDHVRVIVTHTAEHSDLFSRTALMENSYDITVCFQDIERLYVYDSRSAIAEPSYAQRANFEELGSLLPDDPSTDVTLIATKNTDLSPHAIRSQTRTAASLKNSPPFLSDFLNIVSRAAGRVTTPHGRVGRYLGFSRGRITDARAGRVSVTDWIAWCRQLSDEMNARRNAAALFLRYAQRIAPPVPAVPINILIDIGHLDQNFSSSVDNTALYIEDACVDVSPSVTANNTFDFIVTGRDEANRRIQFPCALEYDHAHHRFHFSSDSLQRYQSNEGGEIRNIVEEIEREQAFRIILEGGQHAYAFGEFYGVTPTFAGVKTIVDQLVYAEPAFSTITSEKGSAPGDGQHWTADSLFALIDNTLGGIGDQPPWEVLVCDDMGIEKADFIAYRTKPSAVAFIHAKVSHTTTQLSASALHEVVSQAIKNLDPLRVGGPPLPSNVGNKWKTAWNNGEYTVNSRMRGHTPPTASACAKTLREMLADARTERYVYVVVAGAISRVTLVRELQKPVANRRVQATQAFIQLLSLYSAAASVSVRPIVICN